MDNQEFDQLIEELNEMRAAMFADRFESETSDFEDIARSLDIDLIH